MPMYYDLGERAVSTNGSGNTETAQAAMTSGSQKPSASITGVFANCVGSVAGGGVFTGSTYQTAGTSTTTTTPNKKNPNNAASGLTVNLGGTGNFAVGSGSRFVRVTVGFAGTGGQGGWIAVTPDTAVTLLANGGASGFIQWASLANQASQTYQYEIEWFEN